MHVFMEHLTVEDLEAFRDHGVVSKGYKGLMFILWFLKWLT